MFREKKTVQTPADKTIQALSLSFAYLWNGDYNKDYKAYVYMPECMFTNWHSDGYMVNV